MSLVGSSSGAITGASARTGLAGNDGTGGVLVALATVTGKGFGAVVQAASQHSAVAANANLKHRMFKLGVNAGSNQL